jgi:hypothetical protein
LKRDKFGVFAADTKALPSGNLLCLATMASRSFPSRHKAQQEEEDAAALKLGQGTS